MLAVLAIADKQYASQVERCALSLAPATTVYVFPAVSETVGAVVLVLCTEVTMSAPAGVLVDAPAIDVVQLTGEAVQGVMRVMATAYLRPAWPAMQ